MAGPAGLNESNVGALRCPTEVTTKVERLLFEAISKAEMALKQLPRQGTQVMVSMKDPNRMHGLEGQSVPDLTDKAERGSPAQPAEQRSVSENSLIIGSSPLVINERPGVRYLCCDRFFKCGERNLVAREIWPSDGGCIELNRKELKRFIMDNEARRSDSEYNRRKAGGSPFKEHTTDSESQRTSNEDKVQATHGNATSDTLPDRPNFDNLRANNCEIHRHTGGASPSELSTVSVDTISNNSEKAREYHNMQQNITQIVEYASSEESLSSITETPETLISDTTDVTSQSQEYEQPVMDAYDFMQNRGDQMVPVMKSDGTIVIPGVVHVNNIKNLHGVVLELNVLIKSPDESRRFSVKIDCPQFKPSSVKVNGIETNHLVDNDGHW